MDTSNWIVYESKRYGFDIKHPPGWIVTPARHDWTLEKDAADWGGYGGDDFSPPSKDVFVSVWSTPTNTPETVEGVAAWVEDYCTKGGFSCTGLDKSVRLCSERDCLPGLLVTADGKYAEAFFTGGKHKGQMVGVAVGRPEWHETVTHYGGSRRLLEGFLAGMGVCPARPDGMPPSCG